MSLEESVRELCGNLTSNKASERKKSAESLKDFLTRNAVPNLLSDNTRRNVGFNWTDLFENITEYLLKESEKYESSKTFRSVTYPLCTSILHLCVAGSNKGKAYIKCDKIINVCLFVLRNQRLTNAIGDAYLNLLYKYVLPYENYACHITPSTWEDLLDICITACLSNISELDDFINLKLLWLIIKNGGECCQFALSLRNSLSNVTKYFHKLTINKKTLDVVTDIMTLTLDMLYLENRLSMCEFIEKNLPLVFQFYEQNLDANKKSQLFKLLHISIMIHHPVGRKQNEESALAYNWNEWNKSLQSIMDLIYLETNYIQKKYKQTNNTLHTCPFFIQVAAFTHFLIFETSTQGTDNNYDGETSSKKPRISINKSKNFNDLLHEFEQNQISWIGVIQMYVEHFGHSIYTVDYEILIQILEKLVNSSSINQILSNFETLAKLVLKKIVSQNDNLDQFKELVTLLWNSCVRNSTSMTAAHKSMHGVVQYILSLNLLHYDNVKPLLVLYFEKGMPVSDSSVKTINMLFKKFYTKCCYNFGRMKCFTWFIHGSITNVDVINVRQLFITLLSNENVRPNNSLSSENDDLYNILFKTVDKSLLYSDFELEVSKHVPDNICISQRLEINDDINTHLLEHLQEKLSEYSLNFQEKDLKLVESLKMLSIILAYLDILSKYNFQVRTMKIFCTFKNVLNATFTASMHTLKSDKQIRDKNILLQFLQNILLEEYDAELNTEIRLCIDNDFLHCINDIITSEGPTEDDESDMDMSFNVLKNNCVFFLAAYCREKHSYRDELLELVLNSKLYNLSCPRDLETALKCIRLFNKSDVEDGPIELTFVLMQSMCKNLFRNSNATLKILQTLLLIIDKVWLHSDNLRQNCLIMVKSYLHRCENMYYPPEVAALVYKCIAKITQLNDCASSPMQLTFKDILLGKIKGNIYSIRLYCSYLIKEISQSFSEDDIKSCLINLKDMFTVAVPEENETILKDELRNRTATLLHTYSALTLKNPSRLHRSVLEIMYLQREKSLDKRLLKKVLNIIVTKVTQNSIDIYLDKHILLILQCWLDRKFPLQDLPFYLYGYGSIDSTSTKYLHWLVSADILWYHNGNVQSSDMLQKFKQNMTEESILEQCFSNIIILSLPYIVHEKYRLCSNKELGCKESLNAATKMFQQIRQILKNEKWTKLFVENMDHLVLLTAYHLRDYVEARKVFSVDIPQNIEAYSYNKDVFCAILKYFGELIDGNIMEYLCENQPLTIFKILYKLWNNVLSENIFEFKVISLHTFITFIENIPVGFPSDAVICNYACVNIVRVIKKTDSNIEMGVMSKALLTILMRFSTHKEKVIHTATLSDIFTILMIKKFNNTDCDKVFKFVAENFKNFDKGLEALYTVMTEVGIETCFTEIKFLEKLQKYERNLLYASETTVSKMTKFLSAHRKFVSIAFNKLDSKGFSEDCENSVLHKVIVALCNILRTLNNDKMIVEASNCLAEIGTYDLKTLVTVPPYETTQLINVKPSQYFAITVVKSLLEMIFDENPTVSSKVTEALNHLMKYKDGLLMELELGVVHRQILNCLVPSTCESFAHYTVHTAPTQWIPNNNEDHFQWITRITIDLLDMLASPRNYLSSLRALCNLKPGICQKILPPLVGLLLEYSSEENIQMIGHQINQVFSYIWSTSFYNNTMNSEESTVSKISNILDDDQKQIVQYLLDVVNAIRLQRNHLKIRKSREAVTLSYMKLDYDKLSWAATLADKNIAAIYYGELWAIAENDDVPPSSPEVTANLDGGENVQRILRNCFVSIGELDAIDGCGTAHLTSEEEKRKHLLNTGQYADALLLHDIVLSNGNQIDNRLHHGVVMSLHKSGMHHLALQYIKSFPENDELNDVKYDCLSYLGDWSEIVDTKELEEKTKKPVWNPDIIIKSFRYACLRECMNADPNQGLEVRLEQSLNRAKLATSKLCRILNMENCQNVYKVVANLHLFRDIQDYCSVRCGQTDLSELLSRWQMEKLPSYKDFRHLETLLSQRSLILEHAAKHYERLSSDVIDLQLQYVDMGLSNQRVQMAQRHLEAVKKFKATEKVALIESQIAWAKGHKDIALALLQGIVSDRTLDVKLGAMCLRQYGLWMADCKRENARDIINKYLEKSLEVLNKKDHAETRFKVYHDIAKFADSEYKQIVSYMNSTVFENKVKCIENMKGTAASLKVSQQSLTRDERKALLTNDRFMQLDEAEVTNTRAEKLSFLNLALRYYLLSLRHCEDNNLSIFRVISFWFDNPAFEFEDDSNTNLQDLLQIPSWKFIAVLPQLAPRLTTENSDFAKYLKEILVRCAIEHPHHTLPILFNLKNSDKDNRTLNAGKGKCTSSSRSSGPQEPRVIAAEALVHELTQRPNLTQIISQMELICDAIISFAYFTPKVNNTKPQPIPGSELLSKLRNLDALPIPTVTVPVRKDVDYSNLANITEFEKHFELVGGINYPKKIACRSSDGKCKILLIKGEDDLRQDAVMQQVFSIVNTLLENNPITKKNKLLIRTYKVVPMSRRSGVLEWCEGTMPLGTYLLDAHTRCRPKDMGPTAARMKLKACHDNRKSNQEKLRVFMEILANFKPVFHIFFTEHYHDPITWYERRLAYTRSVATSSMVGYILGLGDRHVQNILIDKKTAEVVHIDFGIAFDQGKALPTPETIPFRLTQDLLAGFGCCGVEGIFRRCCEKTMQLLRDNQETLLTILEVLLCDPLYSWTVKGTLKKSSVHSIREGTAVGSGLAERALLSVGSKLSGTEGGVARAVSVPGQVARLLHAATDPANLSRLFPGWQPYL